MFNSQHDRLDTENRVRFLQVFVFFFFAVLSLGLFFFQIVRYGEYVSLASQNRLRMLRITPPRGVIADSNGVPLAVNVRTFNVNGYPIDLQKDKNIAVVSSLLQRHGIPMDEIKLAETIEKQYSAPYRAITVATNLTFSQVAELIADKDFKDILFLSTVWKRSYPAGEYAAHVVGYVAEITKDELSLRKELSYRGGDMIGKNGIEAWYEEELRGNAGEEVIEVDSRGRKLRDINYKGSQKGNDVVLTIDIAAQRYAAELMGHYRGAVVAMDVNDGSVRCLYSSPSYDPNPLTWGISSKEWAVLTDHIERPMMNRAISGAYPPASTFKVVTASAGLENHVINLNTHVRCPGYYELGNRKFKCWKKTGHGSDNVIEALRDSCDVFFYQVSVWLGIDKLLAMAAIYGVGEKTGIDIPGEITGTIAGADWKKKKIKESWYGGDTVNYSIGQGYLLMTPLQLARVYAALANGGKLLKPRINKAAQIEHRPLEISQQTIKTVQRGLLEVTKSGTGKLANTYGVSIAGKTGTAQNAHGDDHAWFVGYAPADNPRYVVAAIAEAGKAGSSATGPIVGKMLNYLLNGVRYSEPSGIKTEKN